MKVESLPSTLHFRMRSLGWSVKKTLPSASRGRPFGELEVARQLLDRRPRGTQTLERGHGGGHRHGHGEGNGPARASRHVSGLSSVVRAGEYSCSRADSVRGLRDNAPTPRSSPGARRAKLGHASRQEGIDHAS